ncbi:MAG: aldo/keto reductase, partial [Anaerolineales bacterium]|nr:aldo/keto reductase [Anaerolineales bacterium]
RANQASAAGLVGLLAAAAEAGLTVLASAPLLQGSVLGRLPQALRARFGPGLTDAQCALQFVRSAPGLTAALAGMSRTEHVEENMDLIRIPPMPLADFQAVFT